MPKRRRVVDHRGRTWTVTKTTRRDADAEDFRFWFEELSPAQRVRYLLIGAHAVALHARPRATKDLDVLLDPAPPNLRRTLVALSAFFGGADLGYSVEDLADPDAIIQLGLAPVRIDLA